ncbi:MAG: carboxylesterase family protein, partial [Nitrososphaerales archaeon]
MADIGAGTLRGSFEDGVWVFRGVPYASCSGVGRRWRPPGPVLPWTGVREAADWGPVAPQSPPTPGLSIPGDPLTSDEDCLNLNVWTPG